MICVYNLLEFNYYRNEIFGACLHKYNVAIYPSV